mgnify:CR=1 FL=1
MLALVTAYAGAAQLSTDQIVVKPGDTLTKIAGDYRTTVAAIAAANAIEDPNLIVAGRTLLIPSSTGDTSHVVRMGDTVSRLAQIYATTPEAIVPARIKVEATSAGTETSLAPLSTIAFNVKTSLNRMGTT